MRADDCRERSALGANVGTACLKRAASVPERVPFLRNRDTLWIHSLAHVPFGEPVSTSPGHALMCLGGVERSVRMSDGGRVDERYYQAMPARSLAERLTIAARDRIYGDFIRYCRPAPHDTILDVGVSDVVNDAANILASQYPYPTRLTPLAPGAGAQF